MKRGDLYRVHKPRDDPKSYRVFVIVSRPALIESRFSTVICAPVFTSGQGLSTQVSVGPDEGLKHPGSIMCDNLVSLTKTDLTHFIGSLSRAKVGRVAQPKDSLARNPETSYPELRGKDRLKFSA